MRNRGDIEYILNLVHKYKLTSFLYKKIHPLFRPKKKYELYRTVLTVLYILISQTAAHFYLKHMSYNYRQDIKIKDEKIVELSHLRDSLRVELIRTWAIEYNYKNCTKQLERYQNREYMTYTRLLQTYGLRASDFDNTDSAAIKELLNIYDIE